MVEMDNLNKGNCSTFSVLVFFANFQLYPNMEKKLKNIKTGPYNSVRKHIYI